MLSFAPPFRVIAGHPVFADHADRTLFHVLPAMPVLAAGSDGLPEFGLMRYLGDAAGGGALAGGFLSLVTSLDITEATRTLITTRLSDELGRAVRLNDAMFDEGSVELALLGQSSAAGAPDTSPFEVTTLGSGRPSMAGENTAAFQVQLDAQGASLIDAAMGKPGLPALVLYRMVLSGLQPGFDVKISGDWSRLHTEMQSRFKANVYYVRADLDAQLKKSLSAAEIKVETTVFDGDAAAAAAAAERHLIDWVTGTFFDPGYGATPPDQSANLVDSIKNSVLDLVSDLMPGASFKMKALREEDVRSFDARINLTMARRRELVFQGTLGGALESLRVDENGQERPEWPATRAKLSVAVNIAGIPRREVVLGVLDRFDSDGLNAVEIDIALPDPLTGAHLHEASEIFHDAAGRETYAVNLFGAPSEFLTKPYLYRVRTHFDPASRFGAAAMAEGDWTPGRASELIVDPRVDGPYRLRAPRIGVAPGFPFAQFPQVFVEVLRREDDGSEDQRATLTLTPDHPEEVWTFRGLGQVPEQFSTRVTFDRPAAQGGPIIREWTDTTATLITLPDPLPERRRASFFLNLPWDEITMAFLEVRYEDPANGLRIDERINLSSDTPFIERDYAIADPAVSVLRYRLTAFVAMRGLVQGDWHESSETTFVIARELFEMRNIKIRAVGLPIEAHGLTALKIHAELVGSSNTVLKASDFDVPEGRADSALGDWSFPRSEATGASLRIRADWRDVNGFPDDTGWVPLTRDLAVFNLNSLAFSA